MATDIGQWREDNTALAEIGLEFFHSDTRLIVRMSRSLAQRAVDAWERDEVGDYALEKESEEERIVRHRSGSLALIGLAIKKRGHWHDQHVEVSLDAWFIGHALDCADDHGLIVGPPRSDSAHGN